MRAEDVPAFLEELDADTLKGVARGEMDVLFHLTTAAEFGSTILRTTGSASFVETFGDIPKAATERDAFKKADVPFVEPERRDTTEELQRKLISLSKRIYRHLNLSGYARMDYRLSNDGQFYLLEANPNPQIARNEDFADSAAHSGLSYCQMLQKILTLGLSYSDTLWQNLV